MPPQFKELTDFLRDLGIDGIAHTDKTYLAHLIAVHGYLRAQGCSDDVARAGLFHSIYGTEKFQGFKISVERRPEVRAMIGEHAERLAYLNCAMDRATFDRAAEQGKGPYRFVDRLTGQTVELSPADFDDLCRVHLYDWLEQVPRSKEWDYRRPAYRCMAERLGSAACAEYDRVFASETSAAAV